MKLIMHGLGSGNKMAALENLKQLGFSALVDTFDEETLALAQEFGLEMYIFSHAYTAIPAFSDDAFLAEDVFGQKHIWFGSTCPNKSPVRQRNRELVKRWVKHPGVSGIYLDGARFSSPCSNMDFHAFFTCFCLDCQEKAHQWGLDFERMRRDVTVLCQLFHGQTSRPTLANLQYGSLDLLSLLRNLPGVFAWFHFRERCTTEHISEVAKAVHDEDPSAIMAIYSFSPSIASLVGQDYHTLRDHIQVFAPMIYRCYLEGEGPACLNRELARLAEELVCHNVYGEAEAVQLVATLTGFPLEGYHTVEQLGAELPVAAVQMETEKAKAHLDKHHQLLPIIQLDDAQLGQSIQAVYDGGGDGVNFFRYQEELLAGLQVALRSYRGDSHGG